MAIIGSAVLLKKGSSSAGTLVGGMRVTAFTIDTEPVDITSADSVEKWRDLLEGAGNKAMEISMSGILADTAPHLALAQDAAAGAIDAYGLTVGALLTIDGDFLLSQFKANGNHNGEMQYDITLMSSGKPTIATVA
jgi:predicted secreted protein